MEKNQKQCWEDDIYPLLFLVGSIAFALITVVVRYGTGSWTATIVIDFAVACCAIGLWFREKTGDILSQIAIRMSEEVGNSDPVEPEPVESEEANELFEELDSKESVDQKQRLRPCPDCGTNISERANTCPECGRPMSVKENEEKVLLKKNPVMARNDPVTFGLYVALCFVGIGFVLFGLWWIKTRSETLTVTNKKTRFRKGIFSKQTSDIMHESVRNVQVDKGVFQRMFDVGTVSVSSSGQSGVELKIQGIRDPEKVRDVINKHR